MTRTPISEECAAVAFYGIERTGPTAIEDVYREITKWFGELGYVPDKMGVIGPGHSGKLSRCNAKLQKTGFEGATAIEIASTAPAPSARKRNFALHAKYLQTKNKVIFCIVASGSIVPLSHDSMLPMVRTFIDALNPAYGIGFTRDLERGPEAYVFGVSAGSSESPAAIEEGEKIGLWIYGIVEQVWCQGLLRDVYPWNFLMGPHLQRKIGSLSLEKWVRRDAKRGNLMPLSAGVTLWEIDPRKLAEVRKALEDAGAIYRG
jgi:hypothetical protein